MKRLLNLLIVLSFVTLSSAKVINIGYTDIGVEIEYDFTEDLAVTQNPDDPTLTKFSIPGFHNTNINFKI